MGERETDPGQPLATRPLGHQARLAHPGQAPKVLRTEPQVETRFTILLCSLGCVFRAHARGPGAAHVHPVAQQWGLEGDLKRAYALPTVRV